MMELHFAGVVAAAALVPALAMAAGPTTTYNAMSGVPIRLTIIGYCDTHILPGGIDAGALHGKVTITRTTANFCGNPKEPVYDFVYTSNPGFKGDDQVTFYLGSLITSVKVVVQ